jgi:PAS domain S-box-containing protein
LEEILKDNNNSKTNNNIEEQDSKNLQWLVDEESSEKKEDHNTYSPFYGDVTDLNTDRTILDLVGKETMEVLCTDTMYLLDTSVSVYEKNGDYAFGMFVSGWCQLMGAASRRLCNTSDNKEALACGKWHCHENCWNDSAKVAIRTGKSTDIECIGGINLYAEPIYANNQVIGVINIGYGNPPTDEKILKELSEKYQIPYEELITQAKAYKPRPHFIIDIAKRRLGNIAQLIGKIVESAQREKQLQENEKKYRLLAENSVDCIWTLDKDLRFTYLSPSLERILGFKPEEFIGTSLKSHLNEEESKKAQKIVEDFLSDDKNKQKPITLETKASSKQNKEVDLEITGKVLVDEDGRLIGFQGATKDISKRKKAEELLEEGEKKYKTLVEQTPQALFLHDMDGNIVEINKKTINSYGFSREELLRLKAGDIDPDYTEREDKGLFWNEIKNNNIKHFEARHQRKDGTIFPVYISLSAVELGKQKYIVALAEDITERKQTQQALRESEAKYRTIFENVASAICLEEIIYENGKAIDYRILDVNPAYEKVQGINRKKAIGSLASQLYGTGEAPFLDICVKVAQTGKPASFETYFDPSKKYLYITISAPKPGIVSFLTTDISELKKTENELRKLKDSLQVQVDEKTKKLKERLDELERIHQATIEREFRIKELRDEIKSLKNER